eukprot:gnl/MRDRNA2_/MRDRNA2_63180_c0_seq1.p1 gnl/MRDRNA2_/MRDRNA2_63180_c0~~gnl/MRDRNA2_/MRDRNA2_63180_c0_seq1.p1  ORF type:complete len:345 (-),score=87.64 gnl/MRDRNA2_/MRDRNA2_63180_c0_seq1:288-1322(-)
MGNCCNVATENTLGAEKETVQRDETKDPDEEEEEDDNDDDYVDELPPAPASYHTKGQRSSVSAEAYGAWNKKGNFTAPVHPKTEDQKARIKKALQNGFMFSMLDDKDLATVIDAFKEDRRPPGSEVIKQFDEDADSLYLIESGNLAVFKKKDKKDAHPGAQVYEYKEPGGVFGELALLYNCPRAATIRTINDCVLWSIDRETFNHLVKDAAARKRDTYDGFLKSVDLLKSLDPYERSKICDALKVNAYKANDKVIRQGEAGNEFYIIEEGTAEAVKDGKKVMQYAPKSYFGELSLIKDQPRAADVVATTDLKVVTLDRAAFKRLLGPLDTILKERAKDLYSKVQ